MKVAISIISMLVALYVSNKFVSFLRDDHCLDLGGRVTTWGGCELSGSRAEILPLSNAEYALVMLVAIAIALLLSYILNRLAKLMKT